MSERDRRAVDLELDRLLAEGARRAGVRASQDHQDLWSAFTCAAAGGKRFRPALLLATHRALGGQRDRAAIQVGAAIELLHTAFVVQDDVIDGDLVRRGEPNLCGSFTEHAAQGGASAAGARRLGNAAGILAGDLGLLASFRAISRCEAPAATVESLLDLAESTVHASAAGELADVRLQLGLSELPSALQDALSVAELKTAVYSFQLPLQAGALLADASPGTLTALREVGRLLGIGFQLFDDLLGMFGDESRTGKSSAGDLREGKRTVLIAHASTTQAWPLLEPLVGRMDLDEAGARRARELLTECGSRAWAEELARQHLTSAVAAAERHLLPATLVGAMSAATQQILRTVDHTLTRSEQPA